VAQADAGVRFGVLATGARGLTSPGGGEHGWLMHDDPVREILATARVAEEIGLDTVFVPETPRLFPDPLVTLAALAMTTARVRLGSLVIVAPFRHPALLARMVADVDRFSGGRLVLGLGIGETERQFRTIDARWGSVATRRAALDEAIEIATRLWISEPLTFEGRYYRVEDMRVAPGPRQTPGPPLLIAGSGDGTLAQVVRRGDACNLFGGPDQVGERLARLDEICDAAGRPRNEVLRSYYDFPVLATSSAEAEAKLRRVMTEDVIAARGARGLLVVGTPDQAVAHYRSLVHAGIQYFTVNLADTADHETLRLLATEVVPRLTA
jgi:alkanesulfonate monooxygenase SsuD/methylene tetrahydromethanopterin reductase-like flavin-dependent oxidoreductase (luciferase family)